MIYFLKDHDTGLVKIGTTKNLSWRLAVLKSSYPKSDLLGVISGGRKKEAELHNCFSEYRSESVAGNEWFEHSDTIATYIDKNAHMPEPDDLKVKMLRVDPEVKMLIDLYKSELMIKTGKRWSRIAALEHLIRTYRPDIAERVDDIVGVENSEESD